MKKTLDQIKLEKVKNPDLIKGGTGGRRKKKKATYQSSSGAGDQK